MYQKRKYERKKPLDMESQRKLTKDDIRYIFDNAGKVSRREMAEKLQCSTKCLDRIFAGQSYRDWVQEIENEKNNSFDVV